MRTICVSSCAHTHTKKMFTSTGDAYQFEMLVCQSHCKIVSPVCHNFTLEEVEGIPLRQQSTCGLYRKIGLFRLCLGAHMAT